MAYLNENYLKLQAGYLFPEVTRRVREFCEKEPKAAGRLIRCGIGDVTEPLPRAAIEAMKRAVEELGHRETFRGYGPEHGRGLASSRFPCVRRSRCVRPLPPRRGCRRASRADRGSAPPRLRRWPRWRSPRSCRS